MVPSPSALRAQLKTWAQPQAGRLRLANMLGLLDAVCVTAFAWGLSRAVTALWGHAPDMRLVLMPLAVIFGASAVRAGLAAVSQRLNLSIARRVIASVRLNVMAQALAGRINDTRRLNALFEDSEALEGYYARFAQASLQAGVVPLVLIAVIAWQSPVSAAILGLTFVPFLAMMALLGLTSAAESKRQLDALSRLSNLFIDRIRALPLILAFGNGPRQVRAVARAASGVAERTLRVLKIAFLTSAVLEFFSALSVALIAVYCGFYLLGQLPFAVPEHLTLAKAFFVLALSPEVYAPLRRLSAAYHDRQSASAAAHRLMAMAVVPAPEAPAPLAAAPVIHYDGVTCSFPDDPGYRIGPVSFTARPGTVTALTGPTGSGKSTLLRLLLGQGRIMAGAIGIDEQPLAAANGHVAWLSQNPPILAGTLRDNLTLSNHTASPDAIERVIDTVGLRDLVTSRPGGLQHRLDGRGSGLSGGERKRIGLARALLKDAPILLLDEPTADLDAEAEDALIGILPTVFAGRTVILSSHSPRLNALAGQIVRLA